ncbi:uncharacterized protein LOC128998823 [Macrosteles quadrilineatus]|uniref:uncharacterized protein LOC128998823 n=1 Tax=Macrosteles quadrilineatus TaxID=74068 RepID=UPI0023E12B33|nr:uncharacterized protein LOC128998823 [Macrosteles quadrilineatus]
MAGLSAPQPEHPLAPPDSEFDFLFSYPTRQKLKSVIWFQQRQKLISDFLSHPRQKLRSDLLSQPRQKLRSAFLFQPRQKLRSAFLFQLKQKLRSDFLFQPRQKLRSAFLSQPRQKLRSAFLSQPRQKLRSAFLSQPRQKLRSAFLSQPRQKLRSPRQKMRSDFLSQPRQKMRSAFLFQPRQKLRSAFLFQPRQKLKSDFLFQPREKLRSAFLFQPRQKLKSDFLFRSIQKLRSTGLGGSQMMVDKTGVGPDGDDAAVEPEASDPDENPDDEQGNGEDSPCPSLKHEDSIVSGEKGPYSRSKSNQRWMKLRTTVQLSGAISSTIQKSKPPLKREDSFLKRFSTRQVPETQETMDTGDDGEASGSQSGITEDQRQRRKRRRRAKRHPRTVVNPDENFYFYWLMLVAICVLYNLWTLIVRQSFPELQDSATRFWFACDMFTDVVFVLDVVVQFRTGYLEQGLMVYDSKKLAGHYIKSRAFLLDLIALLPLDLIQFNIGVNPILRFPRFLKVSSSFSFVMSKSNQRWMKLRTTVQLSGAISSTIQKSKPPLKREDSFLKRFSTRQVPETQETMDTGDDGEASGSQSGITEDQRQRRKRRRRAKRHPRTVVNPDENFYFYWLMLVAICVLYNLWTLIVRQSFPELQDSATRFWFACDMFTDVVFVLDVVVQFRTGYLEQGLMVYDSKKLAGHYIKSRAFLLDLIALLPLDLIQFNIGVNPILRFPRFLKVYRVYDYYYMVESRTVYPNLWRVMNLIHILLILAHWFGCFYYLLSEAEGFQGDWVYPYRPGDYATLTRKYLGSLYWSTLTLTTIGDLPTPETNADKTSTDGLQTLPRRGHKSRLLQFNSNRGYVFTIVSYLIGVFIFATIVGQVGNVITNRNANRLEFERLLDGAKTYMRHHKVPGGMKRRVLRWYDYSWSRGRIQGGGDINTALGLLPDKLKTELALHVNLSVLKKVTIFHECQPEFLHDLVLKMKAYIFTPGDLICRKGEVAREMFIIADGILEVKSETGRVLTTMKAGDFFGEIGILNLDGLNRRTADVRSVGYSELFSLSREDVLAAMKDYPEAQDILQTLGRKRLMEARSVNRVSKNLGSEGSRCMSSPGSSEIFDNKTGKKIVDKIRSDVKGLKNVLRKSRRGPRSREECMELQPLTISQDRERHSSREGKGILCRMPRVMSDDTSQEDEPYPAQQDTKIGAGLPLLQRLKLLKEKQDKETKLDKEVKQERETTEKSKLTAPEYTGKKEEEREVIGAGLPLLQRLLLLKQKEDRDQETSTIQTTANETAQVLASTVRTQQLRSPSFKSQKSKEKSKDEEPPLKPIILNRVTATKKPKECVGSGKNGGVSWKDDCEVIQSDPKESQRTEISHSVSAVSEEKVVKVEPKKEPVKPKAPLKFQTILKQAGMGVKAEKNDSAALIIKPITTQTESIKLPETAQLSDISVPQEQAPDSSAASIASGVGPSKTKSRSIDSSSGSTSHRDQKDSDKIKTSCLRLKSSEGSSDSAKSEKLNNDLLIERKDSNKSNKIAQDIMNAQSNSISKDNNTNSNSQPSSNKDSILIDIETSSDDQKLGLCKGMSIRRKPLSLRLKNQNKLYKSIEDLSPEYSGLPFVKQLKILNERQKLADLEQKAFLRSSSLDSGHDPESREFNEMYDSKHLTRSHSEAIAIEVVLRNQYMRAQRLAGQDSENSKAFSKQPLSPDGQLTSPESNETVERRHLKSILKKLSSSSLTGTNGNISSENPPVLSNTPAEMRKLMRAQTFEGYAARHSKLTKSVTFNRDTLQSPPSGLASPTTPEPKLTSQFPRISSSLESVASEKIVTRTSVSLENQASGQEPKASETLEPPVSVEDPPVVTVQSSMSVTTDTLSTMVSQMCSLKTTHSTKPFLQPDLRDFKSIDCSKKSQTNWIERPQAKQKNFFRPGSILLPTHASQEEEFFGGILGGIKTIIQNHLEEIQSKFQTRFQDLEMEVKKRDDIIAQLQERIQELENTERENSSDMDEPVDAPFMRGDSVDTVLSSPKRSPWHWRTDKHSWEDHSEEENQELQDLPRSITPQPVWNSTSIDMESDSGSSSTNEMEDVFVGEHNDWEVQMLAKEMERRESLQKSQEGVYELSAKDLQSNVRRRRAISFDSVSKERRGSTRRTGSSEQMEGGDRRRRGRLHSAQSLDERGATGLSALYRRSLSISNLQSTLSNSFFRGLGTFVRGNTPHSYDSPTDVVPTISRSCPAPTPPPRPPDI